MLYEVITTGLILVAPFQHVTGKGMVETDLVPAGVLMTGPAVLFGVIFFVKVLQMDIFMAINA